LELERCVAVRACSRPQIHPPQQVVEARVRAEGLSWLVLRVSNRPACALRRGRRLLSNQTGLSHLLADSVHQLFGESPHGILTSVHV
jgi:hypothetical protein